MDSFPEKASEKLTKYNKKMPKGPQPLGIFKN